jgi:hypothetical protein
MQIASLALQNQTLVVKLQQTGKDAFGNIKYHYKGSGENLVKFSATISEVGISSYILNKLAFTLIIGTGENLIFLYLYLNSSVSFKSFKYRLNYHFFFFKIRNKFCLLGVLSLYNIQVLGLNIFYFVM